MWTSAAQGEGSPIPFYERTASNAPATVFDDEVLLRLSLAPADPSA